MGRTTVLIKRLPKFIGANILGTAIDTVLLWLLSQHIFKGYVGEYIISPIISFECAVLSNFLFSYFGIWKDRAGKYDTKGFIRKYAIYNMSSSVVFILKMGILLCIELLAGWNVVVCNLVALCISGIVNFSLNEWVIFRGRKNRPAPDEAGL